MARTTAEAGRSAGVPSDGPLKSNAKGFFKKLFPQNRDPYGFIIVTEPEELRGRESVFYYEELQIDEEDKLKLIPGLVVRFDLYPKEEDFLITDVDYRARRIRPENPMRLTGTVIQMKTTLDQPFHPRHEQRGHADADGEEDAGGEGEQQQRSSLDFKISIDFLRTQVRVSAETVREYHHRQRRHQWRPVLVAAILPGDQVVVELEWGELVEALCKKRLPIASKLLDHVNASTGSAAAGDSSDAGGARRGARRPRSLSGRRSGHDDHNAAARRHAAPHAPSSRSASRSRRSTGTMTDRSSRPHSLSSRSNTVANGRDGRGGRDYYHGAENDQMAQWGAPQGGPAEQRSSRQEVYGRAMATAATTRQVYRTAAGGGGGRANEAVYHRVHDDVDTDDDTGSELSVGTERANAPCCQHHCFAPNNNAAGSTTRCTTVNSNNNICCTHHSFGGQRSPPPSYAPPAATINGGGGGKCNCCSTAGGQQQLSPSYHQQQQQQNFAAVVPTSKCPFAASPAPPPVPPRNASLSSAFVSNGVQTPHHHHQPGVIYFKTAGAPPLPPPPYHADHTTTMHPVPLRMAPPASAPGAAPCFCSHAPPPASAAPLNTNITHHHQYLHQHHPHTIGMCTQHPTTFKQPF